MLFWPLFITKVLFFYPKTFLIKRTCIEIQLVFVERQHNNLHWCSPHYTLPLICTYMRRGSYNHTDTKKDTKFDLWPLGNCTPKNLSTWFYTRFIQVVHFGWSYCFINISLQCSFMLLLFLFFHIVYKTVICVKPKMSGQLKLLQIDCHIAGHPKVRLFKLIQLQS